MLWLPSPGSDISASDPCSTRFSVHSDVVVLGHWLSKVDVGSRKRGRKHSSHCARKSLAWKESAVACLEPCLKQQTGAFKGCRAPPGTGRWHWSIEAQASRRGRGVSGLVLEPDRRSAAQTLETQLAGIRIDDATEERLAGRLVAGEPFNCSLLHRQDVEDPEDHLAREEQSDCAECEPPENEAHVLELVDKRPAIRMPASNSDSGLHPRVEETMLYLESIGVDCSRIVSKDPTVVTCSVERIRRVVHFLEYLGLKRKELGRIFNMCPRLLHLTVERDLKQAVNFLTNDVGLLRKDFSKVMKRCPRLLACSVEEQLWPTLRFLRCLGFSRMGRVVSNNATLLTFSVEKKLVPKLKFLESLGLSHEEAVSMVVRFPAIFNYSVKENLQPKYDYLVNEMGGNLDDLVAFPHFFGYSLESRIRPRHQFIAERNIRLSVPTMLRLPENEFYSRFGGFKLGDSTKATQPQEINTNEVHYPLLHCSKKFEVHKSGESIFREELGAQTC